MSIYFLCSCTTDWHEQNKLRGHADIPLNNCGREQARIIREKLLEKDIDLILCSPLDRAHETAQIATAGKDIPITFDTRIIERDCGDFECRPAPHGFWDTQHEECDNCESLSNFIARIHDFLYRIQKKYKDQNILIVSHSGVGAAINHYFGNTFSLVEPGGFCEFFPSVVNL